MSSEWIALVITAIVGVAGIAFTWLTGKQARDHTERLARQVAARDHRARIIGFYADLVTSARRLQRASLAWTEDPSAETRAHFMVVLDEYGALAAESRLTQEPKVWQQALALEDTYRTHSRSTQPQVRRGDNRFRLEPLIEVLRQSAPAEADQYS